MTRAGTWGARERAGGGARLPPQPPPRRRRACRETSKGCLLVPRRRAVGARGGQAERRPPQRQGEGHLTGPHPPPRPGAQRSREVCARGRPGLGDGGAAGGCVLAAAVVGGRRGGCCAVASGAAEPIAIARCRGPRATRPAGRPPPLPPGQLPGYSAMFASRTLGGRPGPPAAESRRVCDALGAQGCDAQAAPRRALIAPDQCATHPGGRRRRPRTCLEGRGGRAGAGLARVGSAAENR